MENAKVERKDGVEEMVRVLVLDESLVLGWYCVLMVLLDGEGERNSTLHA